MKSKSMKMMLAGMLLIPMLAFSALLFAPANLVSAACDGKVTINDSSGCSQPNGTSNQLFGAGGIFTTVMNVILFIVGSIAVLMLIYGGVRYTISGGDEKAVTSAKNTILYAIVGIVVALLAYAIVNFVLTALLAG